MDKFLTSNHPPIIIFTIGALCATVLICLIIIFIIHGIINPILIKKFKSINNSLQKITKEFEEMKKRVGQLESISKKLELNNKPAKKPISSYGLKKSQI
ncbi:hypothetical protein [Borreliella burgdorferi]|uniref:hypothetical protein n=1 Tax=Borreliella burgdorferi TaxID=139 RepID=UPI00017F4655|nr:hypothetical protein [Borreliella burgdorferi]ACO38216.1 conserved hypothetical protein [Borreliella burgdorferi 29805]MCD2373044.1 hypothetical protein [Borreliella burgdorferi]MCD2376867.1 hypothetical protein [Borreliella burgdorferi]MCD2376876.1 hypothetical protein [Borreliella burgdorferi]MCD2377994.1 hypothetical protein [Borreliella burgdorferi]